MGKYWFEAFSCEEGKEFFQGLSHEVRKDVFQGLSCLDGKDSLTGHVFLMLTGLAYNRGCSSGS